MKAAKYFIKSINDKNTLTILLMLIILSGCNPEKIEGFKFYENDVHNLSIMYPEDWNARLQSFGNEEAAVGPIVIFQPPSGDSLNAHITIFTEKLPNSVKTADDYFSYSKAMLLSQELKIDIVKDGSTIVNGKNAHWGELDFRQMKMQTMSLTYMFVVDGTGYNISGVTGKESFEKLKPLFEKVSRSLKFD